jgi:predicted amidohydrolase
MTLRVATCQFAVTADPRRNADRIVSQLAVAKRQGAHVAHFCEGALSGYAPHDLPSYTGYDWETLRSAATRVMAAARELQVAAVMGTAHPLGKSRLPHNSVYIIDRRGRLIDRYDKRFCAGAADDPHGELSCYSPGDHACTFSIQGVRCGVLICHEYRYPELVREYTRRGVQLVFHSYHAGNVSPSRLRAMRAQVGAENLQHNRGATLPEITMPASSQAAAAANHLWVSAANSSARHSCFPAFFVRADGVITGKLRRHVAGVLISDLDPNAALYDSTRPWRDRALRGVLHSGSPPRTTRSRDRTAL